MVSIKYIIKLYKEGNSLVKIGNIIKEKPHRIYKILKDNNVKMRPAGYQIGHEFHNGGEKGWFKIGDKPFNIGMKNCEWMDKDKQKERKIKISETLKKQYSNGRISSFLGKSYRKGIKLTKETIKKISEAHTLPDKSTRVSGGYRFIKLNNNWIREHHYIWLKYSEWGFIPKGFVVHHINRNKLDNRIENLTCLPTDIHSAGHIYYEKKLNEWRWQKSSHSRC